MKFGIPLVQGDTDVPCENFWSAILIYLDRPHLINRRLAVVSPAGFFKIQYESSIISHVTEAFTRSALINEIRHLPGIDKALINSNFIRSILEPYDKHNQVFESDLNEFKSSTADTFIAIRILYPRQNKFEKCIEIVVLDKLETSATFFCTVEKDKFSPAPDFPYKIEYSKEVIRILLNEIENADCASGEWLADSLFPKILKWTEEFDYDVKIQRSLALISEEIYSTLYLRLKSKYGEKLIKSWTEKTDPYKFVYEDIAIATYLICLWQNTKVNFVDLGCGNGLLVYILNQEGFPGFGIDVRKRKIWDWYPSETKLKIETINPSTINFPECNWIIGNHSDELTPWIPVITAKNYETNFFLLPCCCYEFSGRKYKRLNSSISSYSDYINYIKKISEDCGFRIQVDKLRIPSTKRICIVSSGRNYLKDEQISMCEKITKLVNENCSEFLPRVAQEPVKNCTRLNKQLIERIIHTTASFLLEEENLMGMWNKGGKMPLETLAQKVNRDDLKQLKSECGGLQTLLKNHRYIFSVKGGLVELCKPVSLTESKGKYKSKNCWFYKNHPNGCFFPEVDCAYKHL